MITSNNNSTIIIIIKLSVKKYQGDVKLQRFVSNSIQTVPSTIYLVFTIYLYKKKS